MSTTILEFYGSDINIHFKEKKNYIIRYFKSKVHFELKKKKKDLWINLCLEITEITALSCFARQLSLCLRRSWANQSSAEVQSAWGYGRH